MCLTSVVKCDKGVLPSPGRGFYQAVLWRQGAGALALYQSAFLALALLGKCITFSVYFGNFTVFWLTVTLLTSITSNLFYTLCVFVFTWFILPLNFMLSILQIYHSSTALFFQNNFVRQLTLAGNKVCSEFYLLCLFLGNFLLVYS